MLEQGAVDICERNWRRRRNSVGGFDWVRATSLVCICKVFVLLQICGWMAAGGWAEALLPTPGPLNKGETQVKDNYRNQWRVISRKIRNAFPKPLGALSCIGMWRKALASLYDDQYWLRKKGNARLRISSYPTAQRYSCWTTSIQHSCTAVWQYAADLMLTGRIFSGINLAARTGRRRSLCGVLIFGLPLCAALDCSTSNWFHKFYNDLKYLSSVPLQKVLITFLLLRLWF